MVWPMAFILMLTSLMLGCQGESTTPPGETFDAGPVFADLTPMISHRFEVRNTTSRPVRILDENHSCSCTSVNVPRILLQPGQTTTLEMKVQTPLTYSNRVLGSTLRTDHPKFPEWSYQLRIESFPKARMASDQVELRLADRVRRETGAPAARRTLLGETWLEVYAPDGRDLPVPTGAHGSESLVVEIESKGEVDSPRAGVQRARYRVELSTLLGEDGGLTGAQNLTTNLEGASLPTDPATSHDLDLAMADPAPSREQAVSGTARIITDRTPFSVVAVPWSVFIHWPKTSGERLPETSSRAVHTHPEEVGR